MSTPLDFGTELAYRRERLTASAARPARSPWFPPRASGDRTVARRDPAISAGRDKASG